MRNTDYQLKQRLHGEGSITIRSGNYQLRWYDSRNRKSCSKTLPVNVGARQADETLDTIIRELKAGTYIPDSKQTLSRYIAEYITYKEKEQIIKQTSAEKYEKVNRLYIQNTPIGKKTLTDVTPQDIRVWYSDLPTTISTNTKLSVCYFLKGVFKRAVKESIIPKTPCVIILPNATKKNIEVLSDVEIKGLIKYLNTIDSVYKMPIMLSVFTGCRKGELLGLTWDNVDLENGTISVVDNLVYCRGHHGIDTPKTPSSRRNISISDDMIEILKEYKETQKLESLCTGVRNTHNLVVPSIQGGYLNLMSYTNTFHKILEDSGITTKHINVHGLRHSHLTLCARFMNPKEVSARAGHRSVVFTLNVYVKANQDLEKAGLVKFAELLAG